MKKIIGCLLFVSIVSYVSAEMPTLSIANYLKSHYLGTTVEYQWFSKPSSGFLGLFGKSKDVPTSDVKTGIAEQVIIGQNDYYLLLDNGDKVQVVFEGSLSTYELNKRLNPTNVDLQLEVLRNQQYLNNALASIGDTNTSGFSANSVDLATSAKTMTDLVSRETNKDSGEEILYTDSDSHNRVKGVANATLNGVFLVGGSEMKLLFVGMEE